MPRQITADDLTDDEIVEHERELFKADADDDLDAYLAGHITVETLMDRLRYHKSVAQSFATTSLCDRKEREREDSFEQGGAA